jgi:hypothetical protein
LEQAFGGNTKSKYTRYNKIILLISIVILIESNARLVWPDMARFHREFGLNSSAAALCAL